MQSVTWQLPRPDYALLRRLVEALPLSLPVAQVLINRGVTTVEAATAFLSGSYADLQDPWRLPGMAAAVREINRAVAAGEKILIYGDYDVDGVTSTALMVELLRSQAAEVDYYLPDRFTTGYGLHREAILQAAADGYGVVIAVDCGITAVEEARLARELGLSLVVMDHHEPPETLPAARAVVCPPAEEELAGVGICYAVARAMEPDKAAAYLDLAALGTLADMVPLTGENRFLVKLGHPLLQEAGRPGIRALWEAAGLERRQAGFREIAYQLIPRLNAAGRLGKADRAVRLLLTTAGQEAWELARELDEVNRQRQLIEKQMLAEAAAMIEQDSIGGHKVLVLSSPFWHEGLLGLVANRVAKEYRRPVVLIAERADSGRGSARSVNGFNLYRALASCADLLIKFGGHPQAAGLEIAPENIGRLRESLNAYVPPADAPTALSPVVVEAVLMPQQVGTALVEEIEKLAPFGTGNAEPVFGFREVELQQVRRVGEGGAHLKAVIKTGESVLPAIGFGLGETTAGLPAGKKVDMAFRLARDDWKASGSGVELVVQEIHPAVTATETAVSPGPVQLVDSGLPASIYYSGEGEGALQVRREVRDRLYRGERVVVCCSSRRRALQRFAESRGRWSPVYLGDGSRPIRETRQIGREFRSTGGLLVATAGFWQELAGDAGVPDLIVFEGRPEGGGEASAALPEVAVTAAPVEGDPGANLRQLVDLPLQTVIFVRTFRQAEKLAARLRAAFPPRSFSILAVHEGLPLSQREEALRLFAEGLVTVVVATPAGSEGLLGQAGQVLFLHFPFSGEDFGHQARVGTTQATLYPLWTARERERNWEYLDRICPGLEQMRQFYRAWRKTGPQGEKGLPPGSYTARAAWSIFEELGLLPGKGSPTGEQIDLRRSWRYREAEKERRELAAWEKGAPPGVN